MKSFGNDLGRFSVALCGRRIYPPPTILFFQLNSYETPVFVHVYHVRQTAPNIRVVVGGEGVRRGSVNLNEFQTVILRCGWLDERRTIIVGIRDD